jgi:hypothetical protein
MLFDLALVQEASGGGQGRDSQTLDGTRAPGLLDSPDLFIKAFHVNSGPPHKRYRCAANVAVEPDQSHTLAL